MANPFAMLADQNAVDLNVVEAEELSTDRQGLLSVSGDSVLQLGTAFGTSYPPRKTQLLAIHEANLCYVTSDNRVSLTTCSAVEKSLTALTGSKSTSVFKPEVDFVVEAAVSHIAFSFDGTSLYVAAADGGLLIYKTANLQGNREELQINALSDLLPNPENGSIAMLSIDGSLRILDAGNMMNIATLVTAASWSKKGKQIVVCHSDGRLSQYTPSGELKATIRTPPAAKVIAIDWLENHLFVLASLDSEDEVKVHLLRRSGTDVKYIQIPNPSLSFGDTSHSPGYHFLHLSRTLLCTASTTSADIGLVSLKNDTTLANDDDEQKATLRFSTDRDIDVSVVGLAVQAVASENKKAVWCLDNDGGCTCYKLKDEEDPLFDAAVPLSNVRAIGQPDSTQAVFGGTNSQLPASSPFAITKDAMPSAFGALSHAQATQPSSVFGSSTASPFGKTATSFGTTSSFGMPATFGSTSSFSGFNMGDANTSTAPTVSFGQSSMDPVTLGSSNFATSSASNPFAGFGQVPVEPLDTILSKETTQTNANDEMQDSENEDEDNKLADIDEQEPINVSTNNPFGSANLDLTESTGPPQLEAAPETRSAFGSGFSFPSATPGGFGFTTEKKPESSPAQEARSQAAETALPTFGFGSAKKEPQLKINSAGFGSGTSFGFGNIAARPEMENARSSNKGVLGIHDVSHAVETTTEKYSPSAVPKATIVDSPSTPDKSSKANARESLNGQRETIASTDPKKELDPQPVSEAATQSQREDETVPKEKRGHREQNNEPQISPISGPQVRSTRSEEDQPSEEDEESEIGSSASAKSHSDLTHSESAEQSVDLHHSEAEFSETDDKDGDEESAAETFTDEDHKSAFIDKVPAFNFKPVPTGSSPFEKTTSAFDLASAKPVQFDFTTIRPHTAPEATSKVSFGEAAKKDVKSFSFPSQKDASETNAFSFTINKDGRNASSFSSAAPEIKSGKTPVANAFSFALAQTETRESPSPASPALSTQAESAANVVTKAPATPAKADQGVQTEIPKTPEAVLLPYITLDKAKQATRASGVAGELEHIFETVNNELQIIDENLRQLDTFINDSTTTNDSLNNVPELINKASNMLTRSTKIQQAFAADLVVVHNLKSSSISLEAQKIKIQRLLRAQTDPAFSATLRQSALGPEYAAQQRELRRLLHSCEKQLTEFQSQLSILKGHVSDDSELPLENITHAIAKITRTASLKQAEIEDLQKHFISLNLSTPERKKPSSSPSLLRKSTSINTTESRKSELLRIFRTAKSATSPIKTIIN